MPKPDSWQRLALQQIVTRREDAIFNASRQSGKTTTVAAAAYLTGCLGGFVLIMSASDRQALEFFTRVMEYHHRLNLATPVGEPVKHEMRLSNGGRILAIPNSEGKIRVFSGVGLLVIDEASRVPDALYGAVRPMLAVSGGQTVILSTPYGQRGFFWKEWTGQGKGGWRRHEVKWDQCPRIPAAFIEQERRSHGDEWVSQEYECQFLSTVGGVFDVAAFEDCVDDELETIQGW